MSRKNKPDNPLGSLVSNLLRLGRKREDGSFTFQLSDGKTTYIARPNPDKAGRYVVTMKKGDGDERKPIFEVAADLMKKEFFRLNPGGKKAAAAPAEDSDLLRRELDLLRRESELAKQKFDTLDRAYYEACEKLKHREDLLDEIEAENEELKKQNEELKKQNEELKKP